MKKGILSLFILLALTLTLVQSASARVIFVYGGSFGATSTFDSVPFGTPTAFQVEAPMGQTPFNYGNFYGEYDTHDLEFTIGGTTYTSNPNDGYVIIGNPANTFTKIVGIVADSSNLFSYFTDPTTLDYLNPPVPTYFTLDQSKNKLTSSHGGMTLSLIDTNNLAHTLVIRDAAGDFSASIQESGPSSVPEPSTFILLGAGLGGLSLLRRKSRKP